MWITSDVVANTFYNFNGIVVADLTIRNVGVFREHHDSASRTTFDVPTANQHAGSRKATLREHPSGGACGVGNDQREVVGRILDAEVGYVAVKAGGKCDFGGLCHVFESVTFGFTIEAMRTLIRNGTVVNADGSSRADVLIVDGKIESVIAGGSSDAQAETVIDAAGKYVIPGGVDPHVHLQLDTGSTVSSDSFATGTVAAAHGGTTTIIDFAEQRAGGNVARSFAERMAEAEGNCAIDWSLHQVLGGVDAQALIDTRNLINDGITSIKLFTAYPGRLYSDDGQILRALQMCADTGMMAMVHAENGLAVDVLIEQAIERGQTDPIFHSLTRPPALEAEAVHRVGVLSRVAGGAPLYIVHLSSSEALDEVVAARAKGTNIFAETCPQYLYLNLEDHLGKGWPDGAGFICSTPLRSKNETHSADLWSGLRRDDLAVVSTDHCPFCMREQKVNAQTSAFNQVPNGIGGIEHRMDLMYQGVVAGHISIERWVELCCAAPARLFGLHPRKGIITAGADADVVVYDPNGETLIGAKSHHMNLDYSAYEGIKIQGKVETVMLGGNVIVRDDQFVGNKSGGRFVRRDLSNVIH